MMMMMMMMAVVMTSYLYMLVPIGETSVDSINMIPCVSLRETSVLFESTRISIGETSVDTLCFIWGNQCSIWVN